MFRISQEKLQGALRELIGSIDHHNRWYRDLIRVLVCRLDANPDDIVSDAHRRCQFGRWYYENLWSDFAANHNFLAIEGDHHRMHTEAGVMLRECAETGKVSETSFMRFVTELDRLHLHMETLKKEIEDVLFNRDALTGAENRLGMLTKLGEFHALAGRGGSSAALIMVDLDDFKKINDIYGHVAGDFVLTSVANHINVHMRRYDHIYRYGGEEFLICLPNTDIQMALQMAERIRYGLEKMKLVLPSLLIPVAMTASFGIALLDPDVPIEVSIDHADQAMYTAKARGKNAIIIWDDAVI